MCKESDDFIPAVAAKPFLHVDELCYDLTGEEGSATVTVSRSIFGFSILGFKVYLSSVQTMHMLLRLRLTGVIIGCIAPLGTPNAKMEKWRLCRHDPESH